MAMGVATASPSTATTLNMVAVFISKVVHVPACKTLGLHPIALIAMVVDSIHKVAHALTCVVVNLNVTVLSTVVAFMPQAFVAVVFVVWTSVATAQIMVCLLALMAPQLPQMEVVTPAMAPVVACACSATPTSTSTTAASPRTALACLVVACLSVTPAHASAM